MAKNGWGGQRRGAGRKRGSKNPNAGRKPGALNMLTRAVLKERDKTDELPHEILLRVSRGERIGGYRPTVKDVLRAAKVAAPYYHPRLRATVAPPVEASILMDEIANLLKNRDRRGLARI